MISATVDTNSLRAAQRAMDAVDKEVNAAVKAAVKEVAAKALANAKRNVAVDTGFLKKVLGVEYGGGGLSAKIGPQDKRAWYAVFVEWGSASVRPRPFQTPAGEIAHAEYLPTMIVNVNRAIGRVARG